MPALRWLVIVGGAALVVLRGLRAVARSRRTPRASDRDRAFHPGLRGSVSAPARRRAHAAEHQAAARRAGGLPPHAACPDCARDAIVARRCGVCCARPPHALAGTARDAERAAARRGTARVARLRRERVGSDRAGRRSGLGASASSMRRAIVSIVCGVLADRVQRAVFAPAGDVRDASRRRRRDAPTRSTRTSRSPRAPRSAHDPRSA